MPSHKQWKREDVKISLGQGWRRVDERVLAYASRLVSLLIDCRFGPSCSGNERVKRVYFAFLGGTESRGGEKAILNHQRIPTLFTEKFTN